MRRLEKGLGRGAVSSPRCEPSASPSLTQLLPDPHFTDGATEEVARLGPGAWIGASVPDTWFKLCPAAD